MKIEGRQSILDLVDQTHKAAGFRSISAAMERAGIPINTIANLRHNKQRGMNLMTFVYLVKTLGRELYALTPEEQELIDGKRKALRATAVEQQPGVSRTPGR